MGKMRLEAAGIPTKRPNDFFCEQVKSDAHMARIKDRLLLEEKKIEGFEKRLQRDNSKKFNKQVSAIKKEDKNSIAKEFKTSSASPSSTSFSSKRGKDFKGASNESSGNNRGKPTKRAIMDKKYGFGGKDHKKNKLNTQK